MLGVFREKNEKSKGKSPGGAPHSPKRYESSPVGYGVAHWAVRSAQASGDADKASGRIEGPSAEIEADSKKIERTSDRVEVIDN